MYRLSMQFRSQISTKGPCVLSPWCYWEGNRTLKRQSLVEGSHVIDNREVWSLPLYGQSPSTIISLDATKGTDKHFGQRKRDISRQEKGKLKL